MSRIHSTAIIEDGAVIGNDVEVGPYAVIGKDAIIGNGCKIFAHAMVSGNTTLGEECEVHPFAHIGGKTQDLKYKGGDTFVEVGPRTVMREYVTINCGTSDGEVTKVGSDCLLMAYCHVAHGCLLEDRVIVSNSTSFAGDVHIGKCATVSGLIGVHQFCRIGAYSMVGPVIAVLQDVPPFMMVAGNPVGIKGTNKVGLTRRGFSDEVRNILRSAYKILCRSGLNVTDAITKINEDLPETPEILELIEFYKSSKRGVIK